MTVTNNGIYFETLEELRTQAINDDACEDGLEWLDKQKSLQEVFEKIDFYYRFWCLWRGYVQFSEFCDWGRLSGENWAGLLSEQLQFSKFCQLKKLDDYYFAYLLHKQPQFEKYKI